MRNTVCEMKILLMGLRADQTQHKSSDVKYLAIGKISSVQHTLLGSLILSLRGFG